MKIGIHQINGSFSDRWIAYCATRNIPYKIVDCYSTNIIPQLAECDALMWHHSQNNPKDLLIAKPILFSFEQSGKVVFPDFKTNWHFDDKLGQKYLLESLGIPFVKSFAFFDKHEAQKWLDQTDFPVVFKLRSGAGSFNVKLVKSKNEALKLIKTAFGRGFSNYNAFAALKEIIRKRNLGKASKKDVLKGIAHLLILPKFAIIAGRERGYIYFQEFIPDNTFDIRVIVIGEKAFAIKRMVRMNDFRASGSGNILYEKEYFDDDTIKLAFEISRKLGSQCSAYDFVFKNGKPFVIEVSYGFNPEGYEACTGYWNSDLEWIPGRFNPYGWMVENVIAQINSTKIA
jgi:glutathione synthase/RimK-type ligase-like ATP-grasp enzyme